MEGAAADRLFNPAGHTIVSADYAAANAQTGAGKRTGDYDAFVCSTLPCGLSFDEERHAYTGGGGDTESGLSGAVVNRCAGNFVVSYFLPNL